MTGVQAKSFPKNTAPLGYAFVVQLGLAMTYVNYQIGVRISILWYSSSYTYFRIDSDFYEQISLSCDCEESNYLWIDRYERHFLYKLVAAEIDFLEAVYFVRV